MPASARHPKAFKFAIVLNFVNAANLPRLQAATKKYCAIFVRETKNRTKIAQKQNKCPFTMKEL